MLSSSPRGDEQTVVVVVPPLRRRRRRRRRRREHDYAILSTICACDFVMGWDFGPPFFP